MADQVLQITKAIMYCPRPLFADPFVSAKFQKLAFLFAF